MIFRNLLLLFASCLAVLYSCNEDNIIVSPICSDGFLNPTYTSAELTISGWHFGSNSIITVFKSGYFSGNGIKVGADSIYKTCNITGQMCPNDSMNINIKYTDTTDNSILRIGLKRDGIFVRGKFWYCDNTNGQCQFVQIGYLGGNYTDHWEGYYDTPLFVGSFLVNLR
jgi:hypothetical protein